MGTFLAFEKSTQIYPNLKWTQHNLIFVLQKDTRNIPMVSNKNGNEWKCPHTHRQKGDFFYQLHFSKHNLTLRCWLTWNIINICLFCLRYTHKRNLMRLLDLLPRRKNQNTNIVQRYVQLTVIAQQNASRKGFWSSSLLWAWLEHTRRQETKLIFILITSRRKKY